MYHSLCLGSGVEIVISPFFVSRESSGLAYGRAIRKHVSGDPLRTKNMKKFGDRTKEKAFNFDFNLQKKQ